MNIIESIYNEPENWRLTTYFFKHKDDKSAGIWIPNGFSHYCIYPNGQWSYFMKLRFHKAFKWWCENRPAVMEE